VFSHVAKQDGAGPPALPTPEEDVGGKYREVLAVLWWLPNSAQTI